MPRARLIGRGTARPVDGEWALAAVAPERARVPQDLVGLALEWIPCDGPTPVAAALRTAGRWDLDHPRDFDAEEWWYRCRFTSLASEPNARLRFEGLATVADVWLNGTHILKSESMFTANVVDVSGVIAGDNELFLRFRALASLLAIKRPRPQWRTRMVAHQQLRWHRTTVLGRAPGWCPSAAPVGPWRPVLLEAASPLECGEANLQVGLHGDDGLVRLTLPLATESGQPLRGAMQVGESSGPVTLGRTADGQPAIEATVCVPNAERWWPHTHGGQPLYPVRVSVDIGNDEINLDLGCVGFRSIWLDRDTDGEGFGLVVNGVPVFCRGACWTPLDLVRLDARATDYRVALERLRDAGMNMLRVAGTTVYETDAFHDLCDELGIFVWQDFMFANMDYPSSDEAFLRDATTEARQVLCRAQGRPSSVVFCGSSEIEQQVAMLGLPPARARNPLFEDVLPSLVRSFIPDAAWVPSTPSGGLFPFHTDRGVSHYYGVGAYLRPFEDTRRANVRFAAECLAFSNVPDATMTEALLAEGVMPGHHPRWKAGVPRDAASGWDFEDVRDHYVRLLFGVDPTELRARDPERYLALGRVATGEAMLRTFAEWRRLGSACRGGLVWFARDLTIGAGWGVIDCTGRPKPAYWYLKRAFAPVALFAVDEGLNGLWLHAVNDTKDPIDAELHVSVFRHGRRQSTAMSTPLTIPARNATSMHADALFDGFRDLTYAYRFGPPQHDVVAATLRDRVTGDILAAAHGFPCGLPAMCDEALGLAARAEASAAGCVITVEAARFAHAVSIEATGFLPDDNFFHIEPGEPRQVFLRGEIPGRAVQGTVTALNGTGPVPILSVVRAEAAC